MSNITPNSPPSINPTDQDSLTGAFRFIITKRLQAVNHKLPAKIISYDRATNRAQVQPLIAVITTNGQIISRPPIASVPVQQLGGGGYFLSFNLKPDDLGWIETNDRDISLFLQSYTESKPNTLRMFDFADSVFVPDVMTGYTIASEDAENCVLQSLDGTVKIALWPDRIKITVPNQVLIEGDLAVVGNITATGTITPMTPPPP